MPFNPTLLPSDPMLVQRTLDPVLPARPTDGCFCSASHNQDRVHHAAFDQIDHAPPPLRLLDPSVVPLPERASPRRQRCCSNQALRRKQSRPIAVRKVIV